MHDISAPPLLVSTALFCCLQKRKIVHAYTSFEYAMKAAGHLEDAEWGLQLREMAIDSGHGSLHLDNLVVKVLARAGRLEEARDVLEVWWACPRCCHYRGP